MGVGDSGEIPDFPFWENRGIGQCVPAHPPGLFSRKVTNMSAAAEVLCMMQGSKGEFLPLFEKAPHGLALCDEDGKIAASNPAFEQIVGVTSPAVLSLRLADLLDPDDRRETERLVAALVEGKRDSFQIQSKTAGRDRRSVRWTAWKVQGVHGGPDCVLAMAEDIAAESGADEHLRQAQRLEVIGRLAGGVAHDFNNLLTGVLLYCDLLMASIDSGHRARKYAEEIRKVGLQATGVVRQLLALAKPTNCQPRLLSLNEIAECMRNLLVRLIGDNIQLRLRLDPQLGLVRMDPSQAQQILLNLVLNSRDAMPGGGEITIETGNCNVQVLPHAALGASPAATLPCALFVVSDNGQGMDESTRGRVFEPFFTTKVGKGTGLGLSTVHHIVTTSGGLICVDSKPAQGTRVSVLLPLVPQESMEPFSSEVLYPENTRKRLSPQIVK